MSLGRPSNTPTGTRDVKADYIAAYLAEYRSYKSSGLDDRANEVAEALKGLGYEVEPPLERAVPDKPETAVEKPRRRVKKAEEPPLETREG